MKLAPRNSAGKRHLALPARACSLLAGFLEESNNSLAAELVPAFKERDFEAEQVAHQVAAQFVDQLACGCGSTACRNEC